MENKVLEYYLKGYGYIQIAKIMGKTPKSIDNALQRIRGKIRNFSLSFWDKKQYNYSNLCDKEQTVI